MAGVISSGPYWKKLEVQITPRIRLLILSLHLAPFIISVGGLDSKVFGAFDFPHSATKSCFHNYIGFLHKHSLGSRFKLLKAPSISRKAVKVDYLTLRLSPMYPIVSWRILSTDRCIINDYLLLLIDVVFRISLVLTSTNHFICKYDERR